MANTNLSTHRYRYQNVARLVNDVAANSYYFFVGDHIPHANLTLQPLYDDVHDVRVAGYSNMIMGKALQSNDILPVIRNVPWVSQLFTMYDDQNNNLIDLDFFCMTHEDSFYHIWKCLDNNNNSNSTIQPVFSEGSNTALYQTSDGYRWKYMSSVSSSTVSKFSTPDYFPLIANASVANSAVPGKIDIILVEGQGEQYNNYLDGTLITNDIRVEGDPTLFNLSNTSLNTTNGFYTGCILYITSGAAEGLYRTITDFQSNSTGNIIKLDQQFLITPDNGSNYEIRPQIQVLGDGNQTINCVARALVNTVNSNSIYRAEILQFGKNYIVANASVIANAVVGIDDDSTAIVRPIMSPHGGHGFDCFGELYCHDAEITCTLANSESNTSPTTNMYQQIGVLKNPLFAEVDVSFLSSTGLFTTDETLYVISPKQLDINVTVTESSVVLACNNANFLNQVAPGDQIIIQTADRNVSQFATVASVTNSSSMNVSSNLLFSCTESIISIANVTANCLVSSITNTSLLTVTNCPPKFGTGSTLIGSQTGAYGIVNTLSRNDVTKGFNSFIELYKYNATLISGAFVENEVVLQGNNTGYVHHYEGTTNIVLYLSNMSVIFDANSTPVVGQMSGAIANLVSQYVREVIPGSGEIEYLENIDPVTRQNTQSESFQLIFNF